MHKFSLLCGLKFKFAMSEDVSSKLYITNSLSRTKELFEPINPPHVGMYVCGPTVYGDAHLGHARPAITFDLLFRYLTHLGYKVRYVRNITDVGHLENDADEGEDKIAIKARVEELEPMEIVQYYTVRYHHNMDQLNVLRPSIEPHASGHIIEQIEMVKKILGKGYAYEAGGSVYFDVEKYSKNHHYGVLSGRKLDELMSNTRELAGQTEKRNSADFAIWKKAEPAHIMRWPSPWSNGFPGWHMECSAMGCKYLGDQFDIHGGGMDLIPTHHTNEVAQSVACNHTTPVRYWLHTNMLTVNGQKMSKSLGNSFLPEELFSGSHPLLDRGYSPMTVRFFMLQAHYSSTLDFTNEALQAAEKGYRRLMSMLENLEALKPSGAVDDTTEKALNASMLAMYAGMNNDFNTPQAIAAMNEASALINTAAHTGSGEISARPDTLERMQNTCRTFVYDVFGLKLEDDAGGDVLDGVMNLVIDIRKEARSNKDFATSDKIRDVLSAVGIVLKDSKEGTTWEQS